MDVSFRIELFGEMRVVQGESIHTRFRTHKAAHLLAYLALHRRQPQPRERLLELFWPDKEDAAARNGLSTALAQLRRQFENNGFPIDRVLIADRQQVGLNTDIVTSDVADFERLLQQAKATEDRPQQAMLLEQAVALYRGDLLPGCYEEWAAQPQSHYQSLYIDSLRRLIRLMTETERVSEALAFAQRAMIADPYAEDIARAQMHLLVHLKQPSVALQTYERLEQLFQRDLGAMPSALTRQMAETIRQDPRALALLRTEQSAVEQAAVPLAPPSPPAAPFSSPPESLSQPVLPLQLTRFFGRVAEREQLAHLIQTPGTRLVSILGPGGAGKTRLAVEVAAQVAPQFANRVWFASLADIPDAGLIPSVLVNILRLPPVGPSDLLERVIAFLGDAPCLLVLDNLEHLLTDPESPGKSDHRALQGSLALIRLLLERAPGLICLVTSRQALRLSGEQEFSLPPLLLPELNMSGGLEALLHNESVELYLDRARTARLDFALTPQNAASVVELCRRLEGMPLALEMAAAWAKTLTPQKMLERLEHQLALLVSRRRDLPPRHQSLRATVEWSYDLLQSELRRVFARLSVFRGGWTLEAAEAVCGADALEALAALQEQSLIVAREEEDETRYRLLEPLREFAREKLLESGERIAPKHARYYLDQALAFRSEWDGPNQLSWLDRLEREIDNLRAAMDYFATDPEGGLDGLDMISAVQRFFRVRGYHGEARQRLQQALAHPGAQERTSRRGNGLNSLGLIAWMQGDYTTATKVITEALDVCREVGYIGGMGVALGNLSNIAQEHCEFDKARQLCEESAALYEQCGDQANRVRCMVGLGNLTHHQKDYKAALAYFEQALLISLEMQNLNTLLSIYSALVFTNCFLGDLQSAGRNLREAVALCRQLRIPQESTYTVQAAAMLATTEERNAQAARLLGAVKGLRSRYQLPLPPDRQGGFDAMIDRMRARLGTAECEALLAEGDAYTWEQALAAALS